MTGAEQYLEFLGSEVQRVEAGGDTLTVLFSVVHVQRPAAEDGFLRPLRLLFCGARVGGPLVNCIGTLSNGWVEQGGIRQRRIPLSGALSGPLVAELQFMSGATLSITAASLVCEVPDDAVFMDSYAC